MITQPRFGSDQRDYESIRSPFAQSSLTESIYPIGYIGFSLVNSYNGCHHLTRADFLSFIIFFFLLFFGSGTQGSENEALKVSGHGP